MNEQYSTLFFQETKGRESQVHDEGHRWMTELALTLWILWDPRVDLGG